MISFFHAEKARLHRGKLHFSLTAEKAGLRRGDLLITVEERDIPDPQALLEVVDAAAIDVPLPLKVLRAGRELTLSVKPEPLPGMA